MSAEAALLVALDAAGIRWSLHEHDPVFTVEASDQVHATIAGQHSKNLFLKDNGGKYWVVCAPHDARVDLKALPAVLGSKKVSFGKADDMVRLLGVTPGSVTPLAVFNNRGGEVGVLLDRRIAEADRVNVHPLRNSATLGVSGADLARFLTLTGHQPLIANIPAPS